MLIPCCGNQTFKDDEFLATALENQIGDVYRYNSGLLYYYQWDDTNDNPDDDAHDNIKSTIHHGTPGQTNQDGDYPQLYELKRIKVAKYDTSTVVSWALPDYYKDTIINGGIIPGMFTHNLGNSVKSIAKKWRQQQFNNRHTDIKEFCLKVFSDPDYDLSNVTKTLRNLPVTDINRDNIKARG